LSSQETESYNACPYCLTEIVVEERASEEVENTSKPEIKEAKIKESSAISVEEKSAKTPKTQVCPHNFGYLSKRSNKEKIPEECMTCENIVQCMLKNVTG
jgi:DNA-directed RNA polymerase subunit RPC12/RpoP